LNFCNNKSLSVNQYLLNGLVINNPSKDVKVNVVTEYWKCSFDYLFQKNSDSNNYISYCNGNSFSTASQIFDTNLDGLCNSQTWTYSSTRINSIPIDIYLNLDLTKCTNMSTQPNKPTSSGNMCSNSVIRVKNIFKWKGGTINTILSQIIYTDISYNANFVSIPQLFETKWLYETSYTLNNINTPTQYSNYVSTSLYINSLRSGIKGYIRGQPLITGYYLENSNQPVNILYDQRISTYKELNGKLCGTNSNLERVLITFNKNTSSNCVVQLNKNDLTTNCNSLRKIIFNKLNDYFAPSNVISINGNPNMSIYNSSDWLKIYPLVRNLNVNDSIYESNQCSNVPYKLNVNIFYSSNNDTITGAYITYSFRNWTFLCKTSDCNSNLVQDFLIEFETIFINTYKYEF
jgi:hypothetical protein